MTIRVYVDFNTLMMDEKERVPINLDDSSQFNENTFGNLQSGLTIILFDEELEVEATLEFDQGLKMWMAIPDWATRKDI